MQRQYRLYLEGCGEVSLLSCRRRQTMQHFQILAHKKERLNWNSRSFECVRERQGDAIFGSSRSRNRRHKNQTAKNQRAAALENVWKQSVTSLLFFTYIDIEKRERGGCRESLRDPFSDTTGLLECKLSPYSIYGCVSEATFGSGGDYCHCTSASGFPRCFDCSCSSIARIIGACSQCSQRERTGKTRTRCGAHAPSFPD